MKKHNLKACSVFYDTAFDTQGTKDPLAADERSKTAAHENRLNFSENSQKILKSEENES